MSSIKNWITKAVSTLVDPDRDERVATLEKTIHHALNKEREKFTLQRHVVGDNYKQADVEVATKNVYRKILSRCWHDGILTPQEKATTRWVARALELSDPAARELDLEFARRQFSLALAEAMDDGVLDSRERAQLTSIAESVDATLADFSRTFFRTEGESFLRAIFLSLVESNRFSNEEWNRLLDTAGVLGITHRELLDSIELQARSFVEHILADAKSDGVITDEEHGVLIWLMDTLHVPQQFRTYVEREIWHLRRLHDITEGRLPSEPAPAGIQIRSGEIVHFSANGVWRQTRMLKAGPKVDDHHGFITLTDNRLILSSQTKSHAINYRKVVSHRGNDSTLEVQIENKPVYVYFLRQPSPYFYPIFNAAVSMANQTLTRRAEAAISRHIPRDVRQRVWQRYGGCCAECRATDYLEFDHVIPFAKGGNNSDNNVQLLCRKCNLKKSDHI